MVKLTKERKSNPRHSREGRPSVLDSTQSRTMSLALAHNEANSVATRRDTSTQPQPQPQPQTRSLPRPPIMSASSDSKSDGAIAYSAASRGRPYPQPIQQPQASASWPRTETEQYWAARALRAEMALKSGETMRAGDDVQQQTTRKEQEQVAHGVRVQTLERIVWILLSAFVALLLLLSYRFTHSFSAPPPTNSWWSLSIKFPDHFTIPILSPFASVAEQSTSTIPFNAIAVTIIVAACLAYAIFRHWMSQLQRR